MLLSKVCVQAFLMPDPRLSTIFPTRPSSVTAVYLPVTALVTSIVQGLTGTAVS